MLTEAEKILIASALDGELSLDESQQFHRLLTFQPEALELYSSLLNDRSRLFAIPIQPAPQSLFASIMTQVKPEPRPITPVAPKPQIRSWSRFGLPASMAASFLLAVASGTYYFTSTPNNSRMAASQLQQLPAVVSPVGPSKGHSADRTNSDTNTPAEQGGALSNWIVQNDTVVESQPIEPTLPPNSIEPTRPATVSPESVLTARPIGSEIRSFDRVHLKLPVLASFSDIEQPDTQSRLKAQFAGHPATRVDLFATDSTRAAESLIAAAQSVELNIMVETIANERMKRKMPSAWILYTEALTADQATKWLASLAAQDNKQPENARVFKIAHASPATDHEQKELLGLLAIDLGVGKKTKDTTTPSGHISSNTIDQVTSSIQKTERPKNGILVTYFPQLVRVHPALSKDIKSFHEQRNHSSTDTIRLVVVIRPAQTNERN